MQAPILRHRSEGASEPADLEPGPPQSLRALVAEVAQACRSAGRSDTTSPGPVGPLDERELHRLQRRHPRPEGGFHSKREILEAFRREPGGYPCDEAEITRMLRTCPTRSLSGIVPVTVLTRPFPCPGRCIFCPSDVRMPKSYVASEPGCQRAEQNGFDPYAQAWSRLDAYRRMGHPTGKVELIVLGGTWSHYPHAYQRWFVMRCLAALSDFGAGLDARPASSHTEPRPAIAPAAPISGRAARGGDYDRAIQQQLRSENGGRLASAAETASWSELEAAKQRNETAACRCVGLSLETRPDRVSVAEARRLRRLGATKVQLGIQSLDDRVLLRSQRGHGVGASHAAMEILRRAGFKLHVHWMANLPGSDAAADRLDFARLFDDPRVRPDELKVYPTSLVETAELMRDYESGRWQPYERETLVALLADCLPRVPEWCRVTRVIRDIPSPEILVGNRETNLREAIEQRLRAEGIALREIRSREVREEVPAPDGLRICERIYETSIGVERFLEARTERGRVAGFLRLALPKGNPPAGFASQFPELEGHALLREVHVYGQATDLGSPAAAAQHTGLGGRLVRLAAQRARDAGHAGLAVISAVGTHGWYRSLGFTIAPGALYPVLDLAQQPAAGRPIH